MSHVSMVSTFLIVLLSNTYAFAQASPYSYRLLKARLSQLTSDDAGYAEARASVRQQEDKLRSLFRDMPPVFPMAVLGGRTISSASSPKDWKTKLELELRRSGIQIRKSGGAYLMIQVSRNPAGYWGASLRVHEQVTLSRPNRATLYCTTYELDSPRSKTQSEAEKDMWAALDEFCLLYMKFSKK